MSPSVQQRLFTRWCRLCGYIPRRMAEVVLGRCRPACPPPELRDALVFFVGEDTTVERRPSGDAA